MNLSINSIEKTAEKCAKLFGKNSVLHTKPVKLEGMNFCNIKYSPFAGDVFECTAKNVPSKPVEIREKIVNAFKKGSEKLSKAEQKEYWAEVKKSGYLKSKTNEDLEDLDDLVKYVRNVAEHRGGNLKQRLNKAMTENVQPFEKQNIKYNQKDYLRIVDYQNDMTYANALREGRKLTEKEIESINHLDEIIKKSKPLEKPMTVLRTVDDDFGLLGNLKVGETLTDKAFLSTSMQWDGVQKMWNAPSHLTKYRFRINLEQGTQGIHCNGVYESSNGKKLYTKYSNEFVLGRDTPLRVTAIDNDLKIIDVTNKLKHTV